MNNSTVMEENFMTFATEGSENQEEVTYTETETENESSPKKMRLSSENDGTEIDTSKTGGLPIRKILKTSAKGRNKFQDGWLNLPEFKDWLARVPEDIYAAHCTVCSTLLKNYSKSELQKHGRGKRHQDNLGSKQSEPTYFITLNPKPMGGDTTMSSEAESAIPAVQYCETAVGNGKHDGRLVTYGDLADLVKGPLSFNFLSEIPYFTGTRKEENLSVAHWFRRFERVATLAGWDGATRLRVLPLRLKGIIEDVFVCIENEYGHNLTYEIARQRMIERLQQR